MVSSMPCLRLEECWYDSLIDALWLRHEVSSRDFSATLTRIYQNIHGKTTGQNVTEHFLAMILLCEIKTPEDFKSLSLGITMVMYCPIANTTPLVHYCMIITFQSLSMDSNSEG